MERWDAYDKDLNKLDLILTRGEQVPKDVYHLVVETLVKHTDNTYLLMKRDYSKPIYGGYFEASAGGSALVNESAKDAIKRELYEETGIKDYIILEQINQSIYMDSIFITYLCVTNVDKSSITLQQSETIDFKWVSEKEFIEYANSDEALPPQIERLHPYIKSIT